MALTVRLATFLDQEPAIQHSRVWHQWQNLVEFGIIGRIGTKAA